MTVLATDDFNRADNADLGALWDVVPNCLAFKILDSAAQPSTSSDLCAESYNGVAWPDDQYSEAALSTESVGDEEGPGVVVRASVAAATCYVLVTSHSEFVPVSILKYVGGVRTTIAYVAQAWTNGDRFRLAVSGALLRVWQNDALILEEVDTEIASGRAGIFFRPTFSVTPERVTNWVGGDMTTSPPVDADYRNFPKFLLRRAA